MADIIDHSEAQDILDFNPFSEQAPQEEEEPEATSGNEEETEEPAPTPPVEETPPTPPTPPPAPDYNKELLEAIRALPQQIKPTEPPKPTPAEEFPSYLYEIKDDLVNAIRAEDPAIVRQAIQYIVQQTALSVHKNLRQEYRTHTQDAVQRYVQTHVKQTRESDEVQTDFYSRYPELNNPAGRSVVIAAAQSLFTDSAPPRYTPQLGDQIAKKAKELIASIAGVPPGPPAAPEAAPKKLKKPPVQTKPTTRPPVEKPDGLAADVQDTLFGRG